MVEHFLRRAAKELMDEIRQRPLTVGWTYSQTDNGELLITATNDAMSSIGCRISEEYPKKLGIEYSVDLEPKAHFRLFPLEPREHEGGTIQYHSGNISMDALNAAKLITNKPSRPGAL